MAAATLSTKKAFSRIMELNTEVGKMKKALQKSAAKIKKIKMAAAKAAIAEVTRTNRKMDSMKKKLKQMQFLVKQSTKRFAGKEVGRAKQAAKMAKEIYYKSRRN